MCLFLTSLLRDQRIDIDEYKIEIRGFCVNFLWVVEAADVASSKTGANSSCIDRSRTEDC